MSTNFEEGAVSLIFTTVFTKCITEHNTVKNLVTQERFFEGGTRAESSRWGDAPGNERNQLLLPPFRFETLQVCACIFLEFPGFENSAKSNFHENVTE